MTALVLNAAKGALRDILISILILIGIVVAIVGAATVNAVALRAQGTAQPMEWVEIKAEVKPPRKNPVGIPADPWSIYQERSASPSKEVARAPHPRL